VNAIIRRLRARKGARRFVSGQLSVVEFFRELDVRGVNYVVLRWYENLPEIDPGEDIDILIADGDVHKVASLLNGRRSRHQAVDLYSETGIDGTSFKTLPYYTPRIAKEILDGAVVWNGLCRVPNPRDAFLSMAYHVVYHKGLASNVPAKSGDGRAGDGYKDHDYVTILADKATNAGVLLDPTDVNLEHLDDLLGKLGWRPPVDTLTKLAAHNPWLKDRLASEEEKISEHLSGLVCFIVRERGVQLLPRIRDTLEKFGFDNLWETSLDDVDGEGLRAHVRGGVWNRGPWSVNGGEPAHLIMAYDVFPVPPHAGEVAKQPGLNNRRILEAKEALRKLYNASRPPEERCNIVHSSDSGAQALQYLRFVDADIEETIKLQANEIYKKHQSPFKIMNELGGSSRRAKVFQIQYGDQPAVLKMFRAGREPFMEREIAARELGEPLANMSEILEAGENYLVLKHYGDSDQLRWMRIPVVNPRGFIRPTYIREIRRILLQFRGAGYDWIDLHPDDLIVDEREGLKALDFEFLQASPATGGGLNGSLALFPPGDDFTGELPVDFGTSAFDPYEKLLRPSTGVPVELFVKDAPGWRLALAQIASLARKAVPASIASLRAWFRTSHLRTQLGAIARRILD